MPLVTIYTSKDNLNSIKDILPALRKFIANALSCKERKLAPKEISIQVTTPSAQLNIANVEINISAFSYPERVKNQDEICLAIKNFILSENPLINSVFAWLQLSELGHSVEE